MNNKLLKTSILSTSILLSATACGPSEPTIDGSTEASLNQSYSVVLNSLPESDRDVFIKSFDQLVLGDIDADDFNSLDEMEEFLAWNNIKEAVEENVDGKTAHEVIEDGSALVAESEKQELKALRQIKSKAEKDFPVLEKVKLTNPALVNVDVGYSSTPYVKVDVDNTTNALITSMDVKIRLHSSGRTLPWREEVEQAFFEGGIEPGEKRHTSILVTTNSDWFSSEIPDEAELLVEPITLYGQGYKELYDISQYDDDAKKRLAELSAKYK